MIPKRIALLVCVIIFLLSGFASYSFFSSKGIGVLVSPLSKYKAPGSDEDMQNGDISNEAKTEACPINGEMLTKSQKKKWETKRPLGVMIENHMDARPQSGLSSADVICEAVAEGGVTRFLAMYYCKDAKYIGPVRSARIYFVRLLQGYGDYPLYAHVGGANCNEETGSGCKNGAKADALGEIRDLGWDAYCDLNQFGVPFPYYWRDYERLPGRVTEHTVYSSTAKLWKYAAEKRNLTNVDEDGKKWNANFTPWKFQDDAKTSKRGDVEKINLGFWNVFESDFAVEWNYNKETNSYVRTNGGELHIDKNTSKPLESKNIIIIFADESQANDGYPGGHILYDIIGSGDGLVFQNGKAIEVTWKKLEAEDNLRFYDEGNKEIEMVRGQVFVEILPVGNKVDY